MPNLALLLSLALGAIQSSSPHQIPQRHFERIFISPMGEPFRTSQAAEDPLLDWFMQADSNRDGALSLVEFAQDATRFFGSLDTDHDGRIGFDEIHRYEWVIAPEIQVGWSPQIRRAGKNVDAGPGSGTLETEGDDSGDNAVQQDDPLSGLEGAGKFGLLNIPEPVTGADRDLDHTITGEEFAATASHRFQLLDTNQDRKLELAELEALRPRPSLARQRHHHHGWHGGNRN